MHGIRWVSTWELRRSPNVARSGRLAGRRTWRTISGTSPVVYRDVVRGVSTPSTVVRVRSPHLGYRALPLFLLRSAACHGQLLEIALRVLCTRRRDLVRPFAVKAAGDTTAWIDALDGLRAIRKDTITLGALVVVWRGPTRREGRGLLLFSRNWVSLLVVRRATSGGCTHKNSCRVVRVRNEVWLGKRGCVCLYLRWHTEGPSQHGALPRARPGMH